MKADYTIYPYYGKKAVVAPLIWEHLGKVNHYIEPFFGGGGVWCYGAAYGYFKTSTINDLYFIIANIWRSLKYQPYETARAADMVVDHGNITNCWAGIWERESEIMAGMLGG